MSEEFIKKAIRTESKIENAEFNQDLMVYGIDVSESIGEILDAVKKNIYYKKPNDKIQNNLDNLINGTEGLAETIVTYDDNLDSIPKSSSNINPRLLHGILGTFTESVEMMSALKIYIQTGTIDLVNLQEEMGDIFWYFAILADEMGVDFTKIQNKVIAKLEKRYPEKFTENNAINRNLDEERKVLEQP